MYWQDYSQIYLFCNFIEFIAVCLGGDFKRFLFQFDAKFHYIDESLTPLVNCFLFIIYL